jgi:hypothetical protein
VRLFIEKMKLNSFNSIHNNRINLNQLNNLTSKIDNVNIRSDFKGPKGWKAPNFIKLLIAIITLLSILSMLVYPFINFFFTTSQFIKKLSKVTTEMRICEINPSIQYILQILFIFTVIFYLGT